MIATAKFDQSNQVTARLPQAASAQRRPASPKLWCTACAELTRMVTPEEALAILEENARFACPVAKSDQDRVVLKAHHLTTSQGSVLICLNSLLPHQFLR